MQRLRRDLTGLGGQIDSDPILIAPFGGAEEMVKDPKAKVFPQRELKFLAVGAGGREVRVA